MNENEMIAIIQKLQQQGMDMGQIKAVISQMGEPKMSRTDGVTITKSEPEVPGAYVDARSKLQDFYASSPRGEATYSDGTARMPGQYVNMNAPVVPTQNPNARVETEGQKTMMKPDGTVVIY